MTEDVYIIAAKRSAVAPKGGAFSTCDLQDMAVPVITDLLTSAGIEKDQVDELIVSNALGAGGNPARLIALAAGLPETVAGLSIDRQCVGGLDAIRLAQAMVASGMAQIVIAGGVESYSRRPIRLRPRAGSPVAEVYDRPAFGPTPETDPDLAEAADALAWTYDITRKAQDDWAMNSHAKALAHREALAQEITPIDGVTQDTYTRALSEKTCARAPMLAGNVTHANAAVSADAAAFVLVVSKDVSQRLKRPALRIVDGITIGADPRAPAFAPVPAINAVVKERARLTHIEMMEAYAAQVIVCVQECGLDPTLVNQRGGALARGHPIGASGAILAVRLFHDLTDRGGLGLAAIAAAGGLGAAMLFEA
jgi:acetyl-CoA C-acetyltransferase